MTTEITVHGEGLRFTQEQRQILLDTFANGASDQEFVALVEVAQKRNLDPFKREIFFVKRWDAGKGREVWATQVSIDGLRLVAERSGLYAGQDEPEFEERDGTLVLARVRVWRKDWPRPAVGVARWSEYVQTTRDKQSGQTRPNAMWAKMPYTMLAKCAEALAIRKAFPESAAGLYTDDEMGQALNDAPAQPPQRADVRPVERKPAQLSDGRDLTPLGVEAPARVVAAQPVEAPAAPAPLAFATPGLSDAELAAMLAMLNSCETVAALDATRAEIRPDVSARATKAQRDALRAAAEKRRAWLGTPRPSDDDPTPPRGGRKSARNDGATGDATHAEAAPSAEAQASIARVAEAGGVHAYLAAKATFTEVQRAVMAHGRHVPGLCDAAVARLEALDAGDEANRRRIVETWRDEGAHREQRATTAAKVRRAA